MFKAEYIVETEVVFVKTTERLI